MSILWCWHNELVHNIIMGNYTKICCCVNTRCIKYIKGVLKFSHLGDFNELLIFKSNANRKMYFAFTCFIKYFGACGLVFRLVRNFSRITIVSYYYINNYFTVNDTYAIVTRTSINVLLLKRVLNLNVPTIIIITFLHSQYSIWSVIENKWTINN